MSARYLLDTDWVIHYLNANATVVERVDACRADGVAVSILTVGELYEGVFGSTDPKDTERTVEQFLRGVPILGIDEPIARRFGKERARLRAAGQLIGDVDLLIGATALTHGLTLLTNNRRHFERFEGLVLESAQ